MKSRRCRVRRPSRRWPCAPGATPRISASGCTGSKGWLWSRRIGHPRRPLLRSSRWHAHGNVYLVHEGPVDGVDLSGTDGAVEVLAVEGDDISVGIVNPDGSRAEMSGNGTRIAAAWLMTRTGSPEAHVHVGPRTVRVRRTADGLYESEFDAVEVSEPELVEGIELTRVT